MEPSAAERAAVLEMMARVVKVRETSEALSEVARMAVGV